MKMNKDNYIVYQEGKGKPIKAWVRGVPLEDNTLKQLYNIATMPYVYKYVAVMADAHAGKGSCVGTVIPCYGAISPATIGVDIGCGMVAQKTNLKVSDIPEGITRLQLYHRLICAVPNGRTDNGGPGDRGAWGNVPEIVQKEWDDNLVLNYCDILREHPEVISKNKVAAVHQLGTLGTGNHFCEVSVDEEDYIWVVIHSGSRGAGARIGSVFTDIAKELMDKYFIELPDPDLAYLPEDSKEFKDYIHAVEWAQDYAQTSRRIMLSNALSAMHNQVGEFGLIGNTIDCKHNYVALENHFSKNVWVVRKGAIRARENDFGIIPGSMGDKSYIVQGKGNLDSLTSCSHGAGRKMSRTQARATFSTNDHEKATEGVTCLKDETVLDETPGSYKNIQDVMEAQKDLVEILHVVKAIICIKGADNSGRSKKVKK
jgi:tRNA-splicing ligase RtcB